MKKQALKVVAKAGYSARGVTYLMIGGLSVLAALGLGGKTADSKGALREFLSQPFGGVIVFLIAGGLVCYALWRAIQSIFDADDHGFGPKGLAIRSGLLVSAFTHSVLAYYCVTLVFQQMASSGGGQEDQVAWLMQQPFGHYLVGLVGVAIVGAGLSQIWKGGTGGYLRHLDFNKREKQAFSWICSFGLIARGIVFVIVGGLFLLAAFRVDPEEAGGVVAALAWLRQQPYGTFLFAAIAGGLLAFGAYSLLEAFYRSVRAPD